MLSSPGPCPSVSRERAREREKDRERKTEKEAEKNWCPAQGVCRPVSSCDESDTSNLLRKQDAHCDVLPRYQVNSLVWRQVCT